MTDANIQLLTLGVMLVLNLIVLIMGFFTYKSVPQSAIQQILDAAEKTASRTQTGMDDEAVKLAKSIVTLLQLAQPTQPTQPVAPAQPEDVKKN